MSTAMMLKLTRIQLYILIFSLPFEYYFAGPEHSIFSTLKLQVVLLAATWAAGQLFDRGSLQRLRDLVSQEIFSDRLILAVLAFVSVQIAASALAPVHKANAWTAGVKTALGGCFAFMSAAMVASPAEGRRRRDLILAALCISGTCVALLGFGERAGIGPFVSAVDVFQPSRFFLGNHLRMVSTMEYPNTAACFLSATICATLVFMVFPASAPKRLWRHACPFMLVVQTVALTLTYSRGAVGASIVGIAVGAWSVRRYIGDRNSIFAVILCLGLLMGGMAYLSLVRSTAEVEKPVIPKRVAHYGLDAGAQAKALRPGTIYTQQIAVQNQSSVVWRRGEQGLAYRWYNFQTKVTSPLILAAEFAADILPQESATIPVALQVPDAPGQYLLIWFVFIQEDGVRELKNSFSPGIVCSVGRGSHAVVPTSGGAGQYAGAIQGERRTLNDTLIPPRWELWSAAWKMVRQRPLLGMGPDNFRLLKWSYMELPKGDETILANSLYLELLSGSGVLGLLSFLWLVWELGARILRRISVADVPARGINFFAISYLAAFMTHGLVDYFLKFTPIFLLFWALLGVLAGEEERGARVPQVIQSAGGSGSDPGPVSL